MYYEVLGTVWVVVSAGFWDWKWRGLKGFLKSTLKVVECWFSILGFWLCLLDKMMFVWAKTKTKHYISATGSLFGQISVLPRWKIMCFVCGFIMVPLDF